MNAEKKKAELKTNEFNKEVEVKDGDATKTYKVKIDAGEDVKFDNQDDFGCKQKKTIKAKVVEKTDANKTKLEEIDKQPKSDIEVALDKTT